MTFEQWYEKEIMEGPDGGPKDLAKAAWEAAFKFGYKAGMLDDGEPAEDYKP